MTTTHLRIITGILFILALGFLIWRRNNKSDY
jgi:LPXTG-motif cell wall-anchored protein